MTDLGWTRLAYLLAVLSVLSALAQLGSPSAEPRSLASDPPDRRPAQTDPTTTNELYRRESISPPTSVAPREKPSAPAVARHLKRAGTRGASVAPGADRAVFYRPAPARVEPEPDGGPVCGNLGRSPSGNRLVFPLPVQHANSYDDTWGAPRPQGGHEGTDLMVPTGTPEYSVTDGTVVPVTGSNGNGWNSLGGYAVMLRAAYSVGPVREGDLFYYAHLQRESALPLGAKVRAGQLLGYAGDTGQGPEVTRGLFPPHLHFGWYDSTGTRSYLPSGAMNPYPLLEWIGAGGGVLGGGMDARYCEVPRSGAPTPSTGEGRWPAAREAGARPDLDTGTRRPAPSPGAAKARSPVRPTEQAGDPTHGAPRAAGPHNAPAKTAPDREPEPPRPQAPRAEPSTRDAAPETDPGRPPAVAHDPKDSPNAPVSSPENVPAEEQGLEAGGSEDAQKDPNEGTEVQDPAGTGREKPEEEEPEEKEPEEKEPEEKEPEEKEPEEEEPGGDTGQPDEETASDEDETASEPDGDPDEAEANAPEDPEDEPPQETTDATTEATTLE